MGAWLQLRVQSSTRPEVESSVQGSPSSQLCWQAPGLPAGMALSQASSGSTTPLPQTPRQSASLGWLQPAGQQQSPARQAVRVWASPRAVQSLASPVRVYCLHALGGGQEVGQEPMAGGAMPGSHDSLGPSTTPLPQTKGQSGSTLWL